MTRWDGIDEFIEVVETGRFTTAAKNLGVSKSYISKQMKALEERFGTRLLQRTTRQMTLTEVGQVFFQQCKKLTAQFEVTEGMVSQLQNAPLGTLKVALNSTYGVQYMAGAVAAFSKEHPQIILEVTSTYDDVDMTADAYDLSIRYGELADSSNLVAKRLGSHAVCLCASPEYFASQGRPSSVQDLKLHNCLVGSRRQWQFQHNGQFTRVRVDGNWISEDGATLLAAALGGIGIAQLPEFYIQDELETGRLEKIEGDWAIFDRVAWAVYPHSRHLSAKVRLFINFVIDYCTSLQDSPFPAN